jgi:hypothetical protein
MLLNNNNTKAYRTTIFLELGLVCRKVELYLYIYLTFRLVATFDLQNR